MKTRVKKLYKTRIEKGLCYRCGKAPAEPTETNQYRNTCAPCREKWRSYIRGNRSKRAAEKAANEMVTLTAQEYAAVADIEKLEE